MLPVQLCRNFDCETDDHVAHVTGLWVGKPLTPKAANRARLGSRIDLQGKRRAESWDLDFISEDRLNEGNFLLHDQIVSFPAEKCVGLDGDIQKQISRRTAKSPGMAFPVDPDPDP